MIGELVDIRMLNGQILAIQQNPISSKVVEETIKTIPYKGQGLKIDDEVENARIPAIAQTFYQYVFLFGVPSPEELFHLYLKQHFNVSDSLCQLKSTSKSYSIKGLKARIYRSYPSLIRDFHFYLLCYESKLFEKVYYSLNADFKEGVDVRVTYKGKNIAVALFVETKRSQSYKKKKYNRHKQLTIPEVCITINPFDKANYVGDYALYQTSHIQQLVEQIQKTA